jgi:hypothetical protein
MPPDCSTHDQPFFREDRRTNDSKGDGYGQRLQELDADNTMIGMRRKARELREREIKIKNNSLAEATSRRLPHGRCTLTDLLAHTLRRSLPHIQNAGGHTHLLQTLPPIGPFASAARTRRRSFLRLV